jgi:site-specific DNA recombinase
MEKKASAPIIYGSYRRKSTDDDRQVLSLDSQDSEIKRKFSNLEIKDLPSESVSAFKPFARPVFKQMIDLIQQGKIQGIVAWHPDRLSRNPLDAAQIIYLLDIGKLKDLKFCSYHFDNSPEGKMMLQMTMSQSKYSSDKLSADVKRGMNAKATSGQRPARANLGYMNSRTNIRGKETISSDPMRFVQVKQLWQMMLTGNYSVPALLKVANKDLHLTQPATKKLPERPLTMNVLYRMFTNSFYYGWYEWPIGSNEWIEGKHEPMITEEEYGRVQLILGKKGTPRPHTHKFAFTGLMRCSCGAMITAEQKIKRQKNGNVHHYVYYHCTKKISSLCTEKSIRLEEFNKQIDDILKNLNISERFKDWAIKYMHEIRKEEAKSQAESLLAKQTALTKVTNQLQYLVIRFTSPDNANEELITTKEMQTVKSKLLKQQAELQDELKAQGEDIAEWVELSERTFNFARYARTWFEHGDLETKRAIFACLGSDLLLKDQKVHLALRKPFKIIFEGLPQAEREIAKLEPLITAENIGRIKDLAEKIPVWSG